ncbi:MAG: CHASE domain-containing protein, partial [Pseudomonadota bacterium]|nr:CHASE domain-containing protein [Pseudomonadota bacterium]
MKKQQYIVSIIIFIVYMLAVIQATDTIVGLLKEREQTKQNERLREVVSLAKSKLEAELFRDVFLADSLATVITIDPQIAIENWTSLGKKLMGKSTHVRNVGIAPNDVILLNYPPKGNEKAIGLDFRTVPKQYRTVLKARQLQDVFLSGPLELVQGGMAVIARFPVFNDYPQNKDYWGSISVVIDYQSLMRVSGFSA